MSHCFPSGARSYRHARRSAERRVRLLATTFAGPITSAAHISPGRDGFYGRRMVVRGRSFTFIINVALLATVGGLVVPALAAADVHSGHCARVDRLRVPGAE